MTLSSSLNRNNYIGDGGQVAFAYQFRIDDETHLKVYLDDVLQGSGYVVSNVGNDNGGTVTFTAPPGSAVVVTLLRELPLTQPTDIPTQGPLNSAALEQQMDQTVMQVQQLDEKIGRSLVLPVSSDITDIALPTPAAGNLLGWDSGASALQNYAPGALAAIVPSAYMATLLDDGDAATAQATLGLKDGTTDLSIRSLAFPAVDAILDTDANSKFLASQDWLGDFFEARYFDKPVHDPKLIADKLSWWPKSGRFDWRLEQISGNVDLVAINPRTGAEYKRYTSADFAWLGAKTATCIAAGHAVVVVGSTAGLCAFDFRDGVPIQRPFDATSLTDVDIHALAVGLSGPNALVQGNGIKPVFAWAYGAGVDVAGFVQDDWHTVRNKTGTISGAHAAITISHGRVGVLRNSSAVNAFGESVSFMHDITADDWGSNDIAVNNSWPRFFGAETFAATDGRGGYLLGSAEGVDLLFRPPRTGASGNVLGFSIDSTRCLARAGNHKSSWFLDSIPADRGPAGTTLSGGESLTQAAASGTSTKQMTTGFGPTSAEHVELASANGIVNGTGEVFISADFRSDGLLDTGIDNVILEWSDDSGAFNGAYITMYASPSGIVCSVADNGGSSTAVTITGGPTTAQLNDDPNTVHNVTLQIVPALGIFVWFDGLLLGFDGSATFVNSLTPAARTNRLRIGEAAINSSGPHTASAPFLGSIGEVTLSFDNKTINPDAIAWWVENRIRSYDANVVCILLANEAPTHGALDRTVLGNVPEGIVCGPTKTFKIRGVAITEVDLATPGINADVDQVYISRGEIGLLSSTGQHYRLADAVNVEDQLNGVGHNGGPRWLDPVGKTYIQAGRASPATNVTGDGTPYTVIFQDDMGSSNVVLDTATGRLIVLVGGDYLIVAGLDLDGLEAATTRAGGWVYDTSGNTLFQVHDYTMDYTASNRFAGTSSDIRWLFPGDTLRLIAYAAGGTKVVDVNGGGNVVQRLVKLDLQMVG
ncbi:MAG: hypothetical protein HQ495_04425 [Alphaproteobacteria bacterium]|nr:hypothetical protein [Alphaproteobacteria bacterium]